jgi:GNAT superfamily N-acetyltransferase
MVESADIQLRPLRAGDAPALLAFYNGLSRASIRTFRPLGETTTLDVCEEIVRDNAADRGVRFDLAACHAGATLAPAHAAGASAGVIGWAFLRRLDTDRPELGLGVADAHQGRGLGGALLDRLLTWVRGRKIPTVYLIAVKDNARAVHLYQSRGFVIYDEFIGKWDNLPYLSMRLLCA